MPKNTFNKLNIEKRAIIQNAFYREFSLKLFDDASITQVVKDLGIAKGSIYQYFESKIELYTHLMMEAGALKAQLVEEIKREDYHSFWAYMTDLYKAGLAFDKKHFLESCFLNTAYNNVNSPTIKTIVNQWNKDIHLEFTRKVQYEIDAGLFHNEIPVNELAFILHQNLKSIHEYMMGIKEVGIEKKVNELQGIYSPDMEVKLLEIVNNHFVIMKKAFNKNI